MLKQTALDQALIHRRVFRKRVIEFLDEFENTTGLIVSEIAITRIEVTGQGDEHRKYKHEVQIRVGIPDEVGP